MMSERYRIRLVIAKRNNVVIDLFLPFYEHRYLVPSFVP